jgi:RNA polymerase sigma factor (sigma-70 family)
MKNKQKSEKQLNKWERKLREEGLYPEPYPEHCLSLENLPDTEYQDIERDWSFVSEVIDSIPWLSSRQKEIFLLKCQGCSLTQIADILRLSPGTVRGYWSRIRKKIIKKK